MLWSSPHLQVAHSSDHGVGTSYGRPCCAPGLTTSLRHSFVAIMVAAGCNVREVSEWAGHNSVAFTLTRYGGLFEDNTDTAIDRLDALLGGFCDAREEASGGLSGTAMGRLDWRRNAAADDVQIVAERWSSPASDTAAYVGRRTAQRPWRTCPRHPAAGRAIQLCSQVGRPQLPAPSRVRQRLQPMARPRRRLSQPRPIRPVQFRMAQARMGQAKNEGVDALRPTSRLDHDCRALLTANPHQLLHVSIRYI
jgi:hypothetical protein